jgi:hypothetical protein
MTAFERCLTTTGLLELPAIANLHQNVAASPKQRQVLVTPLDAPNDRNWGALQSFMEAIRL